MATRQVSERRQHKFASWLAIRCGVPSPAIHETRQPQTVVAPAHHRYRVQVAADIEMARPGFMSMAEPEGAEGRGGFPLQALEPAAPLVVAIDQPQWAPQQLR